MKKVFKVLFPASLWKKSFVFSVLCMLALFLTFDVLWCFQTTFRPMSWATTYLYAFLASIVLCLPSVLLPRFRWVQLLLFIAVYIALEANLMYFRTYFCAIPGAAYLLVGNMAEFKDSIYDSFRSNSKSSFILSKIRTIIHFTTNNKSKSIIIPNTLFSFSFLKE